MLNVKITASLWLGDGAVPNIDGYGYQNTRHQIGVHKKSVARKYLLINQRVRIFTTRVLTFLPCWCIREGAHEKVTIWLNLLTQN